VAEVRQAPVAEVRQAPVVEVRPGPVAEVRQAPVAEVRQAPAAAGEHREPPRSPEPDRTAAVGRPRAPRDRPVGTCDG
jgi:hypothetical protein